MKCAALAVSGAILALAVRRENGPFAALVGIASVWMLGVLTLELLKPVLTFAEDVREKAQLSRGVVAPVLKTLAISVLIEIGKNICEDAGEKAIGGALQFAGGVAAFYVLLPLLQGVLDLLDRIL